MSALVQTVSDDTFDEAVLGADGPVLVDFWAPWCAPCTALAPVLDDLAESYRGRLTIAKVDIQDNPQVMVRQGVMAVPTLLLFDRGALVDAIRAPISRAAIVRALDTHLG